MATISIYLPEDLARRVKEAGNNINLSRLAQAAFRAALDERACRGLTDGIEPDLQSLPTAIPKESKRFWNNGGMLSVTP